MNGGLIIALQQIINRTTTTTDIDYVISEYILRNLDNENLTLSQIAKDCHISKASVTRFVQNLGYSAFSDFKLDFQVIKFERNELMIDFKAKKK